MGNTFANNFVNATGADITVDLYTAGGYIGLNLFELKNGTGVKIFSPTCIKFISRDGTRLRVTELDGTVISEDTSRCFTAPSEGITYIITK